MRHIGSFVLLAALSLPLAAGAEGAQSVELTQDVAAPPEEVWAAIGDVQDMSWHPAVFATEGEGGSDVGATRVLTLGEAGGPTISEVLDAHDPEATRYGYRITEVAPEVLPVATYASEITVAPGADGGSTVEWRGTFDRSDPAEAPAEGQDDAAAVAAVTGVYRAGLDALAERFGAAN